MVRSSSQNEDDDEDSTSDEDEGLVHADMDSRHSKRYEPGSIIGLREQLLGKPLEKSYVTSSYCHLIFIDALAYLKEASPCGNKKLHKALFNELARECLPKLLGVKFTEASLNDSNLVDIVVEDDISEDPSWGGHSMYFTDLAEFEETRPIERSFTLLSVHRSASASSENATARSKRHVAVLEKNAFYMLLRGSILGKCPSSPEVEHVHQMVESIRDIASSGPCLLPSSDLEHLQSIMDRLVEAKKGGGSVETLAAPALIQGGVEGRICVSARTVIMRLPSYFKAARAAVKWLAKTRARTNDTTFNMSSIDDIEPISPRTPRSARIESFEFEDTTPNFSLRHSDNEEVILDP